ncbi:MULTISPECIES: hypothetical protein [unclassified Treponema]|uniref:hypothetical protein n=1 Tax=unclassified Treponema TaxID=2638727 RepID=UPI0020A44C5B|nr:MULTISPECIES: hypothetical protein [unclassified Treponema]UTC68132.1 hypothetical protein E4O06_05720 [Treponema sp. OMZ 789]UTC70854.1 hypothetical protein E4O01_05865 [Treponema sp. OMZ 790]UTC73594.1 hypothetical protein E4O02_06060 [Treponema sp. OMZ 791]
MTNFKTKISDILKNIQDFFSNNRKLVIIIVCVLIFLLILSLVLLIIFSQKKEDTAYSKEKKTVLSSKNSDFKSGKINTDKLQLIDEPLYLPPIQFSREQRKIWEKEEVDYWYEPPSKEDIEELHKQNKKLVDNILEGAP